MSKDYMRIGRESGFAFALELAIADTKKSERRRAARILSKTVSHKFWSSIPSVAEKNILEILAPRKSGRES